MQQQPVLGHRRELRGIFLWRRNFCWHSSHGRRSQHQLTQHNRSHVCWSDQINHFPGTWCLGNKDSLAICINRMRRFAGMKSKKGDSSGVAITILFMPRAYLRTRHIYYIYIACIHAIAPSCLCSFSTCGQPLELHTRLLRASARPKRLPARNRAATGQYHGNGCLIERQPRSFSRTGARQTVDREAVPRLLRRRDSRVVVEANAGRGRKVVEGRQARRSGCTAVHRAPATDKRFQVRHAAICPCHIL